MAHIILFDDLWTLGNHKHVVGNEPNLNADDDNTFNDKTCSFVIVSGFWQLYQDSNYTTQMGGIFGPGIYYDAQQLYPGFVGNALSSLQPVSGGSNAVYGSALLGVTTIFSQPFYQGDHRHVFDNNLFGAMGYSFSDFNFGGEACSMVVDYGNPPVKPNATPSFLELVRQSPGGPLRRPTFKRVVVGGPLLGYGAYSNLSVDGMPNDTMCSLLVGGAGADPQPAMYGDQGFGHIILFINENFHGPHKHVYQSCNLNLGTGYDDSFYNAVSSFFIEKGAWVFFTGANYQQQNLMPGWDTSTFSTYSPVDTLAWQPPPFAPVGACYYVGDYNMANDAIGSLAPPPQLYSFNSSEVGLGQIYAWFVFVLDFEIVAGSLVVTLDMGTVPAGSPNGLTGYFPIRSYYDANGNGWATAYAMLLPLASSSNHMVKVMYRQTTQFGGAPKSVQLEWQTPDTAPPPPQPPSKVIVPNVVGMTLANAANTIDNSGLVQGNEPGDPTGFGPFWVSAQSVAPYTSVNRGTTVLLTFSTNQVSNGYSSAIIENENSTDAYDIYVVVSSNSSVFKFLDTLGAGDQYTVALAAGAWNTICAFDEGSNPSSTEPDFVSTPMFGVSNGPQFPDLITFT